MRTIKRLIAAMICMALMVQTTGYEVNAAGTDDFTRDQKAELLNSLDILQGDGTSYNLNAQLKRSEAAAFIVRLLGKEDEVDEKSEDYIYTSYTDVSPDEWYAKYVGYCDEVGIINGYSDKTFRPDEYVSERAFIKLILSALSYAYNVDFTWSSVFKKGVDVGVISGTSYSTMTDDNTSYTRGGVVDAVFAALAAAPNGNSAKLFQTFLDSNMLTEASAVEFGMITNTVDTELTGVTVLNDVTVEITFNESVVAPILEDVFVYEADDPDSYLTVSSIAPTSDDNDAFLITFSDIQGIDVDYVVSIASITDKEGSNVTEGMDIAFKGFRPDEIVSNYFMISKVSGVSENVVYVYFTHPVNENILVPSNFSLLQDDEVVVKGSSSNLTVSLLSNVDNGVALYFKDHTFTEEEAFTLEVDGDAISLYGVWLNDGDGDQVDFTAEVKANKDFEVLEIKAVSETVIRLVFNRAVNATLANQKYNFYLTDADDTAIEISKSLLDTSNNQMVYLTINAELDEDDAYELMINNLNDATKQYAISEETYDVECDFESIDSLEIASVTAVDLQTLKVNLSTIPDKDSALVLSNYSVTGVTDRSYVANPVAVLYDPDTNNQVVKLFFEDDAIFEEDDKYKLTLMANIKDQFGNTQSSADTQTFVCEEDEVLDTTIDSADVVGKNTVKLTFTKELAFDANNITASNYFASYNLDGSAYKKIPISVSYIDATTIILKFDSLDEDEEYALGYIKLVDFLDQEYSFNSGDSVDLDWN